MIIQITVFGLIALNTLAVVAVASPAIWGLTGATLVAAKLGK